MRKTVLSNFMPLANQAKINGAKREKLHRWIAQGAEIGK